MLAMQFITLEIDFSKKYMNIFDDQMACSLYQEREKEKRQIRGKELISFWAVVRARFLFYFSKDSFMLY